MTPTDTPIPHPTGEPVRLPSRKRRPLLEFVLPATAVGSGAMLLLAVSAILDASTVLDWAKAVTLAFSATTVAYAVNKLAVERGAELGTTGYHGATVVGIGSILAVGSGLFAATYAGLTLKDTGELQLQEYGRALSLHVGARSSAASAAARIEPAIRATETDLNEKAACETATSCISGLRNGGNGTVARTARMMAGRAASISKQVAAGETARERIVQRLNGDIAAFQDILGDEGLGFNERRAKLQVVDSRIRQAVGALDAVVPLPLVAAYATELQSGITMPGRPDAEARLNTILARHGKGLDSVVGGIEEVKTVPPSFPGRPGVSDTFRYIAHFLPVAAIAAVVELIFPLVLFAYTFWSLSWSKHKEDPPAQDDRPVPTVPMLSGQVPPAALVATGPQEPAKRAAGGTGLRERALRRLDAAGRREDA